MFCRCDICVTPSGTLSNLRDTAFRALCFGERLELTRNEKLQPSVLERKLECMYQVPALIRVHWRHGTQFFGETESCWRKTSLLIRHIPCTQPLCDAFPWDAVIFASKIVILAALVALVQTLCDTFPLHAVFFVLLSICTKIPLTLSVLFISKIVIPSSAINQGSFGARDSIFWRTRVMLEKDLSFSASLTLHLALNFV